VDGMVCLRVGGGLDDGKGNADMQDVDLKATMSDLDDTIEKIDLNVMGKESQGWLAGYGKETRRHTAQMITA
jgi:hypothetical protein